MPSVSNLMTSDVITIDVGKSVYDAAILMSREEKGCLVVTEAGVPVGIVTERDFVRRVISKRLPLETKVSEVMSKPLITVDADSSLRDAARLMLKNRIRRLPAVKGDKLVGILVASDFATHLSKATITEEILSAMGRYAGYPYPQM